MLTEQTEYILKVQVPCRIHNHAVAPEPLTHCGLDQVLPFQKDLVVHGPEAPLLVSIPVRRNRPKSIWAMDSRLLWHLKAVQETTCLARTQKI